MRTWSWVVIVLACGACAEKKESTPAPSVSVTVTATAPATATATPPQPPDAVAAQHVLVAYKGAQNAPKTVTRTKADAKRLAEDIANRAKGGEDFTSLVAAYSDDPGSKERQGNLGKFGRDKMVKPFSDAAFTLPVGGVSGAVETPFGFHVIKRNQ
jgi:parvulin-like peptidyl-prolyl isomerase